MLKCFFSTTSITKNVYSEYLFLNIIVFIIVINTNYASPALTGKPINRTSDMTFRARISKDYDVFLFVFLILIFDKIESIIPIPTEKRSVVTPEKRYIMKEGVNCSKSESL